MIKCNFRKARLIMKKIQDVCELVSGTPQFRISESFDENTPVYYFYGQSEIECDLIGMDLGVEVRKKVRTFDIVNTVKSGDVIFSLISGKASLVSAFHSGFLFTQNYIKIVVPKSIDEKFLIYILNENVNIKRQLQTGLQGSMVLKYTIKQLRELELPKLPLIEKQKIIGEVYFNQLRLQALRNRAASTETTIVLEKIKEAKR